MTKLDETVEESEFIKIFNACIKIPNEHQDTRPQIIIQIERICNGSRSTKLTPNIKLLLLKYNDKFDIYDHQISKNIFFSHFSMIKLLLNIFPECRIKRNKVYLTKILFDFIFYTPGLYRDIILYHENLKNIINDKIHEFINSTDGKYDFYKDYLNEYNKHVQSILLF